MTGKTNYCAAAPTPTIPPLARMQRHIALFRSLLTDTFTLAQRDHVMFGAVLCRALW